MGVEGGDDGFPEMLITGSGRDGLGGEGGAGGGNRKFIIIYYYPNFYLGVGVKEVFTPPSPIVQLSLENVYSKNLKNL